MVLSFTYCSQLQKVYSEFQKMVQHNFLENIKVLILIIPWNIVNLPFLPLSNKMAQFLIILVLVPLHRMVALKANIDIS